MKKAREVAKQVEAYRRLKQQLENYCALIVLDFDELAAVEFQRLNKPALRRIGQFDLKIAAIALANKATLLSRNLQDFRQIPGLQVEDWTR